MKKTMFIRLLTLLWSIGITDGKHFNGGTINWVPIDPYVNSSTVPITITQTYSWTYPYITCATNVPISTAGRSSQNSNLTCVVDCSTDGGYSTHPIDILTDCTSASSSLSMMSSTRSNNITLNASAHFYLAFVGSAWVGLDTPAQTGLQWSIVTFIDLRMRPDGFINTPPVASVVSPQYAIVNRTVQINIPVSDANAGDDVRCRWSTYTPGYRRRKRSDKEEDISQTKDEEIVHRRKRQYCSFGCYYGCTCSDSGCSGTNCGSGTCTIYFYGCTATVATPTTTTATTTTIATITTAVSTTTIATTTIETQGTLQSTSSYPHQQALDECGGICYPGTVPNGTSISNCTISFTGLTAGVWYAVAIQVEDFINETSTTPMSSVPVQLLIYVMPTPNCSKSPIILPVNGCLEVQVGVAIGFDLYAMNLCNSSVANLTDLIVSTGINGMIHGNLTSSPTNSSLSYVHFTWTPQANQIGSQELCTIAYTSELAQSTPYCVTFTVKSTSDLCVTTTTTTTTTTTVTTTSTTSASTTTTSQTTTTTTSTTTSATTTTTTVTTTTSTTSTSTTSSTSSTSTSSTSTSSSTTSTTSSTTSSSSSSTSTSSSTSSTTSSTTSSSTSSTSTSSSTSSTTSSTTSSSTSSTSTSSSTSSTTSTSTSTTTTSTSTTSTTSSTTSTSTSTTTTSVTTTTATTTTVTTATTTTVTTATTTTVTTATTTTVTTTKAAGSSINWPLIVGLSLLAALLALCCCCFCLYKFFWSPAARRRQREHREADVGKQAFEPRYFTANSRKIQAANGLFLTSTAIKNYQMYDKLHGTSSINSSLQTDSHMNLSNRSISVKTNAFAENKPTFVPSVRRIKRAEIKNANDTEDVRMKSLNNRGDNRMTSNMSRAEAEFVSVSKISKLDIINEDERQNSNITRQQSSNIETVSRSKTVGVNVVKAFRNKTAANQQGPSSNITYETMMNSEIYTAEMQPIGNRSKTVTDNKTKTSNGLPLRKLRKK